MMYIIAVLLLATPGLCTYRDIYPIDPELVQHPHTFQITRTTHYLECPERAICANAHDFNRDFQNGTVIPERRIIRHCHCPGKTLCPIDPEHRLYSSISVREYFCEPVSNLRPCNPTNRLDVSKELIQGDPIFDYFIYSIVNCICPRHRTPQVVRRGIARATVYLRSDYRNWREGRFVQLRACDTRPDDDVL